jgi:hypothetical protein
MKPLSGCKVVGSIYPRADSLFAPATTVGRQAIELAYFEPELQTWPGAELAARTNRKVTIAEKRRAFIGGYSFAISRYSITEDSHDPN